MQDFFYYIIKKLYSYDIENRILKYFNNKDKIVFDVGCFKGDFTENFIKNEQKLGIKSNFFLFDPNPNVKNYLRLLLEKEKVQYFNLAFDNSNSNKKFYLNNWFEPSGSSLVSIMKDDNIWKLRKTFMQILQPFKRIKDFTEIDVKTQTLDNFCLSQKIENIDVLKIDTEGNEANVLKGAKKLLLENKIKLIYVEIVDAKKTFKEKEKSLIDFLNDYNFDLKKTYSTWGVELTSGLKATDNLFVHKSLLI